MRHGLVALVFAIGACSSEDVEPTEPPVDVTLGTFRVHLEPRPLRIEVRAADGTVLFDGLPPAAVAPQTEDTDPPPLTGLAIRDVKTKVEALYGSYQFTDTGSGWRVGQRAGSVKTASDSLTFDALDSAGTKIASVAIRTDAAGEISVAITPSESPKDGARTWTSIGGRCDAKDRFLGFGAQARDVEHRGTSVPIFVSEPGIGKRDDDLPSPIYFVAGTRHASSFPAPIYLARRGYVGALDGPGRALFAMCSEREDVLRIASDSTASPGGAFTFRIFAGPTPTEALTKATARFGRPRNPPRLAFAPWNDAIFGSDVVRAHAKYLRDKDVPSAAIWSEDWRGGAFKGDDYRLEEEWDVDRTLYPDLEKLAEDLHTQGFAFFVYFNTFVEQGLKIATEATAADALVKKSDGTPYIFTSAKQRPSGIIDLNGEPGRAFVVGKLRKALAMGADGWMGDFAEWLPLDAKLADGSDPWAAHDLYPKAWQEIQRKALDADDIGGAAPPKNRRLTFVRSGWLGSAPLADVVWAGDQRTDMEADDGLPTVIPMGLGLGIAGISTYGSDIGGYQSATNETSSKETFFRWVELGAWSPVMRTHHGTAPKKEWRLDSDDATLAHYRRYAILHLRLLPMWESLASEATATGIPIWRHPAIGFPNDEDAWRVFDSFMVGPSIYVAPVQTKGAVKRSVYLPKGARWLPFVPSVTSAWIEGGRTLDADAPLEEVPVYLREGAIVVMLPERVRTVLDGTVGVTSVGDVGDDREIIVAAGPDSTFKETGGLTYALTGASTLKIPAASTKWEGKDLPSCATATPPPCATSTAGRTVAQVIGPGTLTLGDAKITLTGGSATHAITIDVRAP